MAQMIQMIGLDFDATLVEHSHADGVSRISPQTCATLASLATAGVHVGIISGRQWWSARDKLVELGVTWGQPWPTFVSSREAYLHWQIDGRMVPDREWNRARSEEVGRLIGALADWHYELFVELEEAGFAMRNYQLTGDEGLLALLYDVEDAKRARIWLDERARHLPGARIFRNGRAVHIGLDTAGKGRTLLRAAETRGLNPNQVLAIGDSGNDLDMLDGELGFVSATVGNAEDTIKDTVRRSGGFVASREATWGVEEILTEVAERGLLPLL